MAQDLNVKKTAKQGINTVFKLMSIALPVVIGIYTVRLIDRYVLKNKVKALSTEE